MITENLSTLKIHKLTQEQYDREFEAGRIDPSALYLTPDEQGGNADTLDGKHASDFVTNTRYTQETSALIKEIGDVFATKDELDSYLTYEYYNNDIKGFDTELQRINLNCDNNTTKIETLESKVGNETVARQIAVALANFQSGKTLTQHLTEEDMILTSRQYGDTLPTPEVPGRIFFKRVFE